MNRRKLIILLLSVIVAVLAGTTYAFYAMQRTPDEDTAVANPRYNPNYANAIEQKNPALCDHIKFAMKSLGNDDIVDVYGAEAKKLCKTQVEAGLFECECDASTTLDRLREPKVETKR